MALLYSSYDVCFKDAKIGSESGAEESQLESRPVTTCPVLSYLQEALDTVTWAVHMVARSGLCSQAALVRSQLHYRSTMQLRQMCSPVCLNFFNL